MFGKSLFLLALDHESPVAQSEQLALLLGHANEELFCVLREPLEWDASDRFGQLGKLGLENGKEARHVLELHDGRDTLVDDLRECLAKGEWIAANRLDSRLQIFGCLLVRDGLLVRVDQLLEDLTLLLLGPGRDVQLG